MAETGFHQTQGLSLQTTITPQMQQSLQVLQAPTFELRQLVQQEIMENPVLEEEETFAEPPSDEPGAPEPEAASESKDDFAEEFEQLSRLDDDWRDYMIQNRRLSGNSPEDEEKRSHLMESLTAPETLQEHLLQQLGMADVSTETRHSAELLIGMVDDNGFLTASIEDISMQERVPIEPLRVARALLFSFHPVGVGALDLRECLLLQLARLGKEHSLEARIVANHLNDLAMKRYPMLAKKFGVTVQQVSQAAEFIATLNPRPGQMFTPDRNNYINPDVFVERDNGDWSITLNNSDIPQLRISNAYKDMMAEGGQDSEVRRYIKDKIRNGKFLIRSIHQRQETIEKIAREIVRHQADFLAEGPSHLRPLNMAQVAEVVGVHETTVSRAVSGKYMSTPQGTYEMKYFFTTGYTTHGGEELSNTSVKNALLELLKNEAPGTVFSDDELVKMLKEQGIPIARRTVAKYRQQLNILPSHMRRQY